MGVTLPQYFQPVCYRSILKYRMLSKVTPLLGCFEVFLQVGEINLLPKNLSELSARNAGRDFGEVTALSKRRRWPQGLEEVASTH